VENWLLAHFTEINLEETQCNRCEQKLKDYIPSYRKNDSDLFKTHISQDKIDVAVRNYPELGEMVEKFFKFITS
jgi:hypothetical protein